jgi:hypothetical protein
MSAARRAAIERESARSRPRRDNSRRSVHRALRRAADLLGGAARVRLTSDKKSTYPSIAREVIGAARLRHTRASSKLRRTVANPLFAINQTEAIARDLVGRLRRESWLVSKKRRYLDLALQMFITYRNYVRTRFNRDKESPAMKLGIVRRRLTVQEVVGWRQDWGKRSIHPLAES